MKINSKIFFCCHCCQFISMTFSYLYIMVAALLAPAALSHYQDV